MAWATRRPQGPRQEQQQYSCVCESLAQAQREEKRNGTKRTADSLSKSFALKERIEVVSEERSGSRGLFCL